MIRPQEFVADLPSVSYLPPAAQEVVAEAGAPEADAGQLWRLVWADLPARLAMVVASEGSYSHVVPVTFDESQRVDAAVVVVDTPLQRPLVVWPQLRTGVGHFVFAEFFGMFGKGTTETITRTSVGRPTEADLESWNSGLTQTQVGERRQFRDKLAMDFSAFCDSEWNEFTLADEPELLLVSDNVPSGVTISGLCDVLHLDPTEAFRVWQGEVPLPFGALAALSEVYGGLPDSALRAVPQEARVVFDSPSERSAFDAVATREQVQEHEVRRSLYRELVAAPARESGPRTAGMYKQRLRMLLDERLHQRH